jgi:hypothetical protein
VLKLDFKKNNKEVLDQETIDFFFNYLNNEVKVLKLKINRIVVFRDGFDPQKFQETEQKLYKAWGKSLNIEMVPVLIIKRHLIRILIGEGNYSGLSYSKIFDNLSVYSTAERGNKASKPFQVFYDGNLDITPFIADSCALHW